VAWLSIDCCLRRQESPSELALESGIVPNGDSGYSAALMAKIGNSKDLIMLLLYAPGARGKPCDPIIGQTRLMKMVFLFQQELFKKFSFNESIDEKAFPDFEPFSYGPYAGQIYADLEFLVNYQFVDVDKGDGPEASEEERQEFDYWSATEDAEEEVDVARLGRAFQLSDRGKDFIAKAGLWSRLSDKQQAALSEFKKRCTSTTLRSLLRYVYSNYPSMTKKSLIKDEILD